MLYNSSTGYKPPQTTKPPVMSLEGLIQWLETQEPNTCYKYSDSKTCLLARYLKAKGFYGVSCSSTYFNHRTWFGFSPRKRVAIPIEMDTVAVSNRTFGQALMHARHLI